MQPATSATQKADRPSLRDRFAFSIKRQMSDEIGLADDASDRPVLFADDNKPNMWTGKSSGCIPQYRVSCDHSKARLSDRREVDRHIGRGRIEVGRAPVIQAPELRASFEIMRYELTDHEWAAIKPMLPKKPRGVPRVNDRRVLNGIFWVLGSGVPWRDLPDSFGPCITCYNRLPSDRPRSRSCYFSFKDFSFARDLGQSGRQSRIKPGGLCGDLNGFVTNRRGSGSATPRLPQA